MNHLGLDYGEKHIGVAIAVGSLAEPLTTISTSTAFRSLKSLIEKQSIEAIVIGVPDAGENPSVKDLAHQLSALNRPVYFVDETLTSHDARRALLHTTPARRKSLEHAVSAALILQSWLDSHSLNS